MPATEALLNHEFSYHITSVAKILQEMRITLEQVGADSCQDGQQRSQMLKLFGLPLSF